LNNFFYKKEKKKKKEAKNTQNLKLEPKWSNNHSAKQQFVTKDLVS